ncbi:MAG: YicC family protein [Lachnospiraceae bacterium]|jgi:uncharacterized protein (TIGR00255 family)|nr:YicC family protein [Lachnospiraceae bacterium]
MLKSMTGFGRCEVHEGERRFTVEIKGVNHRYLDFGIRMPKKLGFFESAVRGELKKHMERGKVEVFIGYEDLTEANYCVKYNKELAGDYFRHLVQMAADFGLENDVRASTLSRYPEVLAMEEQTVDEAALWEHLQKALLGAVEQFDEAKIREGANLGKDLLDKLAAMSGYVEAIAARAPQIAIQYQEKLRERVELLLADAKVDESRLLTEVAIFAERACLDEELVRLRSHIEAMSAALKEGGGIGRKLDFLAQEMNREANTIMSKANDLDVTGNALELKTEIEKIREQIQNIE